MPSYYVDTGCDNQRRVDNCDSQAEAIEEFRGRWDLEECKDEPSYRGWSKVTFYVSPPFELCAYEDCDEERLDDFTDLCDDHYTEEHSEDEED